MFLTLIRRGSKCERLRNPTNVSAAAGGRLPTPTCPRTERRRGELGLLYLLAKGNQESSRYVREVLPSSSFHGILVISLRAGQEPNLI